MNEHHLSALYQTSQMTLYRLSCISDYIPQNKLIQWDRIILDKPIVVFM
jgi:hypothetical protein